MKLLKGVEGIARTALLGMAVLGLAACTSASLSTAAGNTSQAPKPAYTEAKCSSLHRVLLKVEHDAEHQEQQIAANPSYPASAIATAWLPPAAFGNDLKALAAAVKPYGNAPSSKVTRVTNQAGVVHKDLSHWLDSTSPGTAGHLPDNWQADFSHFQTDIWKLASDCGIARGTERGVALPVPPPSSPSPTPSPSPSPSPTPSPSPSFSSSPPPPPPTSPAPVQTTASGAWCTATASVYYAPDDENNVYVNSNQPYTDATASADGYSWSYETNSSGYAVIYLNGPPAGADITVTVGAATCTATWT